MRNLKLLFIALLLISCREDLDRNNIIGTWKLAAQLIDPGDGSGKLISVSSNKTITFKTDGTYHSNGNFCYINTQSNESSTGNYTYNATEKKLKPSCNMIEFSLNPGHNLILQNGDLLISYFGCDEPCQQKYIKIKD